MITADLHVHLRVSRHMPFSVAEFDASVREARGAGLAGFALTEHFGREGFWAMHQELGRHYLYAAGAYQLEGGFVVLTGAEVRLASGGDLLLIGPLDLLWQLDCTLTRPLAEGYAPTFDEVVPAARALGLIVVGAHPSREGKRLAGLGPDRLASLDALELNARDLYLDAEGLARLDALVAEHDLAVVAGSDAHVAAQIGVVATELSLRRLSFAGLRACLDAGATQLLARPDGAEVLRACRRYRKHLKRYWSAAPDRARTDTRAA